MLLGASQCGSSWADGRSVPTAECQSRNSKSPRASGGELPAAQTRSPVVDCDERCVSTVVGASADAAGCRRRRVLHAGAGADEFAAGARCGRWWPRIPPPDAVTQRSSTGGPARAASTQLLDAGAPPVESSLRCWRAIGVRPTRRSHEARRGSKEDRPAITS
jgi:hypothetical protein